MLRLFMNLDDGQALPGSRRGPRGEVTVETYSILDGVGDDSTHIGRNLLDKVAPSPANRVVVFTISVKARAGVSIS